MSPLVLVLDDEKDIRELIAFILEQAGYRTVQAGSVAEAKRVFREHRGEIEATILDIQLPDGESDEFYEFMLQELGGTAPPTIVITGGPANTRAMSYYRRHGVEIIKKPFKPFSVVVTYLNGLLKSSRPLATA